MEIRIPRCISVSGRTGCAPPCSAPTTGSCRPRSLVPAVAASGGSRAAILTAGVAGLVAGALSMAAGEYVSVSSQRDTERADIRLEERELLRDPEGELRELAGLYEQRGLAPGARDRGSGGLVAPGRAGGARPRRAGARRAATGAPVSGGVDIRAVVLGWSGVAAVGRCGGAGGGAAAVAVVVTLVALGLLGDLGARLGGRRAVARRSGFSRGAPWRWRSPRASAHSSVPSPSDGRPVGSDA